MNREACFFCHDAAVIMQTARKMKETTTICTYQNEASYFFIVTYILYGMFFHHLVKKLAEIICLYKKICNFAPVIIAVL